VQELQGAQQRAADDRYRDIAASFDLFADEADHWTAKTDGYHGLVESIFRALIPRDATVLEIGCGRGDLLAAVSPSRGVGVDVSLKMVDAALERHPELEFVHASGESISLGEAFDFIILSDLVPYVYDLQALMSAVAAHSHARTRIVANTYSQLWRGPLWVLQVLGLRPSRPVRNWVAPRDLINLFELAGLEVITQRREILLPLRGSVVQFANAVLARLPGIRSLTLTYWLIARPLPRSVPDSGVTVVVPCRNEAGLIDSIVERIPEMGRGTEILFVEGGSTDDTAARVQEAIERNPGRDMRLLVQSGKGKANAVHEGFHAAKHDVLMILDADLTVAPEDLPKFYDALVAGRGELINGSRLVYGMDPGAMRFLNMVANKLFAWLMSAILGQYVKDTLCGTKALRRGDYARMMSQRSEIGPDDPYGDFDLLLGASVIGLKVLNVPVRYGTRTYGETNIQRFSGGGMLARLAVAGFRRIWMRPVDR
jgi:SAM-dependent methyltransferase